MPGETQAAHGELESFDRIYMGVDWGFAPDPYAFIRLHYDPARETIFLLDELYALRKTNSETADELLTRGYTDAVITCDSAEPKSVADYRSLDPKSTKNPALDYYHPEDFYEDYYDDFWDYEDAEDYWEEYG